MIMPEVYKMRKRYTAEDIDIVTSKPKYGFPRNVILKTKRMVLRVYKICPERIRDIIEEVAKNGFSGDFRRLIIADLFTHAFFFNNKNNEAPSLSVVDPSDFRGRIRHHAHHHHHHHDHDFPPPAEMNLHDTER